MVRSPIEYIYSAVLKAFFIDDLEVEFIKEFLLLYLSLIKVFKDDEIYKVLMICINLHLIFSSVEVDFPFFK